MSLPEELDPPEPQRLVWLLPLIVLAAWWPFAPYWQSDDFIAVHYATDFGRALGDFSHNQYDLQGMVWFYRPLITLSFAFDALIGGANPFFSHLSNAVAHSISALLIARIALRFLGPMRGFCAGLLWGLAPSHIGSIHWAVGRVDSHTTVWILLASLLCLRGLEGKPRNRWLSVGVFALALASKELAWVTPGIIAVLSFSLLRRDGTVLRDSLIRSAKCTLPFVLLLGAYFALRYTALGRLIGGYRGGELDVLASISGLGSTVGQLIDPMQYAPGSDLIAEIVTLPSWSHWLVLVPLAWTVMQLIRLRAYPQLLACSLLFLGCVVPVYQFWADISNGLNLRYYYLGFAALAGFLAIGGRTTLILILVCWSLPFVQMRQEYQEQAADNRAVHARILEAAADLGSANLFVSGIPVTNQSARVPAMHLGIDRLLRSPFVESKQRVFALRPLGQEGNVYRLPYGDEQGLPFGTSLALADPSIVGRLPKTRIPDLDLRLEGPAKLDLTTLRRLVAGETELRIVTPKVHADVYRVTLFTAGGYLSFFAPNAAAKGSADGHIDLWKELRTAALYVHSDTPLATGYTALALEVPTTMDLEPSFPVLVESGSYVQTVAGMGFKARRANHQILWLHFDHDYARFIRGE